MENEGFIKLYRKVLDNPIICKDSDYFSIWIYLLLNATHKEYDVFFKNNRITLKEGQLITGRKIIAEKFNIDENKVQRILKTFENEHQIEQQTCSKNRLISIVSWKDYQLKRQQIEQQVNNERTTSEQRVNTNKNVNNIKNDNNYIYYINKYKGERIISFADKVKWLNKIKDEEEYKNITADEERQLTGYVLGNAR